ncbi:MAG: pseudaminic acid synthase [Flavobacteriaceae bacterium]|nr:pseudaminic acid synthase [Flavobacteriaceae bacterium]
MLNEIEISGTKIGTKHPPYIVAEISANHNGSLEDAKRLVEAGQSVGVNAIKIQTYTPDTITLRCNSDDFCINEGLWRGRTLYELYEEAHTPWEWHKELFEFAHGKGVTIFSSPFDFSAVDFLEDLGAPAYKIASFEIVDLPLIRYAASTGKPLIISTGMASKTEIAEAVEAARNAGCEQLVLLRCVSSYPAPAQDYNLSTMRDMSESCGVLTGLSDHTIGNTTAISSISLGACLIEKHFTLNRNGGGPDDSFSVEPEEMGVLCKEAKVAWQSLGQVDYSIKSSETSSIKFRRSLYFVKDIAAGDTITEDSIRSVRPGYGISPKYFNNLIGRVVPKSQCKNCPVPMDALDWKQIE